MTRKQKEKDIEKKVRELVKDSTARMRKNIRRAIDCGALNLDEHEGDYIIPKIIFLALLKDISFQYHFLTTNEKEQKKYNKAIENIYHIM